MNGLSTRLVAIHNCITIVNVKPQVFEVSHSTWTSNQVASMHVLFISNMQPCPPATPHDLIALAHHLRLLKEITIIMYYDTDKVMVLTYNYTTAGNTIDVLSKESNVKGSFHLLGKF